MAKLRGKSDSGHGGKDSGAVGNGLKEKDLVLKIENSFVRGMGLNGVQMTRSRSTDTFVELTKRNVGKYDFFISHHINSASSAQANGVEVLYNSGVKGSKELAQKVLDRLMRTGVFKSNRGIKVRNNLAVLKNKNHPSCLIEYGFIKNKEEITKVNNNLDKLGIAAANGVLDYFGKTKPTPSKPTPVKGKEKIMNKATGTIQQMQDWATSKKANPTFIKLAPVFYEVSVRNGVNPIVTYAQSAKETGYMKFGGVLDESFKNPCGLKIPAGGGDKNPNAHKRFKTWEEGIEAQVNHLALYAGAKGYPKKNTPDPRHFPYLHGKCPTVESLGGNWAPSKNYGTDLVKMMRDIEKTPVKKPTTKNTVKVKLFGKIREMNGVIENGTSYMVIAGNKIPLRQTFEDLGFKVDWDNKERMVVIS